MYARFILDRGFWFVVFNATFSNIQLYHGDQFVCQTNMHLIMWIENALKFCGKLIHFYKERISFLFYCEDGKRGAVSWLSMNAVEVKALNTTNQNQSIKSIRCTFCEISIEFYSTFEKTIIINNYFYYYDIALRGLINSPWNVCPLYFQFVCQTNMHLIMWIENALKFCGKLIHFYKERISFLF
jgi:hypothetical protein